MNKLKAVAEWYRGANTIVCVENTYIPENAGRHRTILKAGATVAQCLDEKGRSYFIQYPRRAADVISVTDDTISYYLDSKIERLAGHYVTNRKVTA